MSVLVACECGQSFELRDEFRGRTVRCPHCARTSIAVDVRPDDPIFGRETFLLRQKALAISEKYFVNDEAGKPLLFVKRPARLLRAVFALLMAFAAMFVMSLIGALAAAASPGLVGNSINLVCTLLMFPAFLLTAMGLMPKRHVTFHAGSDENAPKVLEVRQNHRIEFPRKTFTVVDASGASLALLRKNVLTNLFRKQWRVNASNGRPLFIIKEDSIILSLLRRVLGPLFGLLRTNFLFTKVGSGQVMGEFKRKLTILDRYVLDMSADPARVIDRRVAVAAAVMLDTGERR